MTSTAISCDALVVGGGVAGLFVLDALCARGLSALLIERTALGSGQTTASQGILHAGVKYALAGAIGEDARQVSAASALWTARLAAPTGDLCAVKKLSDSCYLWRSKGIRGMVALAAATHALTTRPRRVAIAERPSWLSEVAGDVLELPESVIDPRSLLEELARPHTQQIGLGKVVHVHRDGGALEISLDTGSATTVRCEQLILAAGAGNEALALLAGSPTPMQRRPLRQALLRGKLPLAFGHCIDGSKTRVTVTSERLSSGEVVWNIGGQIAEVGATMSASEFERHARNEIESALPGLVLTGCTFASLLVDRAEPMTPGGGRPACAYAHTTDRVTTLWPVKLVLAPKIAADVAARIAMNLTRHVNAVVEWPREVPRPPLADRPWQHASWSALQ